jgi:glycosyltransferase involved in cell wall biosynthesis
MQSVLNQTYSSIEFLIIDDCGNDGTIGVVEEFQKDHPRGKDIRILRNEKNMGVSFCRNRIIDEAMGQFLYFMDSDDTIEPFTIQILIDAVRRTHSQIAYGSYEIIDLVNNSPVQKYQKADIQLTGDGELAMYAFSHINVFHVSVCNNLVNLDFLRQTGIRFINAHYWEDMAYTTELVTKLTRAVLLSNITYHYMWRPDSLSHYQNREHLHKDEIMDNISVINYLKGNCKIWKNEVYTPYLCKNLEMNSFYIACHIIKNAHRIDPCFSNQEIQNILHHPLSLWNILHFGHLKLINIALWSLGRMPLFFFLPTIRLLGKLKKAI